MPDFTATAASTVAVSDTAAFLIFIISGIISITAENLSEKFTLITILISESHLRKSRLCENAAIKWHYMMNRKTILTQGHDLVTETSCNWTKVLSIILNTSLFWLSLLLLSVNTFSEAVEIRFRQWSQSNMTSSSWSSICPSFLLLTCGTDL